MQSLGAQRRPAPPRRDPAPSRWSYRMQRLWLTPLFRVMFRVGLPVALAAAVTGLYLADQDRRERLFSAATDLREKFENRPEFRVALVSIEGASPELADAVRARLDLKLPQSSFDLDLDAARQRAEDLDAVASAELRVRPGGVLEVTITEREPAFVWRLGDELELIDATGHRVAGLAARSDRPDLPLIAGAGADRATAEALALIEAAGPILPRLRGLVRMGERRWDIVLDRDQRILLPEHEALRALERLLALDHATDLLARDLATVDLRDEHRPALRLSPFALKELREARGLIEAVENDL